MLHCYVCQSCMWAALLISSRRDCLISYSIMSIFEPLPPLLAGLLSYTFDNVLTDDQDHVEHLTILSKIVGVFCVRFVKCQFPCLAACIYISLFYLRLVLRSYITSCNNCFSDWPTVFRRLLIFDMTGLLSWTQSDPCILTCASSDLWANWDSEGLLPLHPSIQTQSTPHTFHSDDNSSS